MDSRKTLKLAYRVMQICIAVACLLLAFTLYSHQRDAGRDGQLLSKHNELIVSSQKMLDDVRRQQTSAKDLLTAAQSRLAAAESRQTAEKAGASQKAP